MPVNPLKSRPVPSADPGRVAGTPPVSGDSEAGAVPQGTLSSERMHTVLRRLADGFYDGADVRTEIARRVRPDIGNSTPE